MKGVAAAQQRPEAANFAGLLLLDLPKYLDPNERKRWYCLTSPRLKQFDIQEFINKEPGQQDAWRNAYG
jgi:hypothetical protein